MEPYDLRINLLNLQREFPHRTGWRSLPMVLVQEIISGEYAIDFDDGDSLRLTGPGQWWIVPERMRHCIYVPEGNGPVVTRSFHVNCTPRDGRLLSEKWAFPRHIEGSTTTLLAGAADRLCAIAHEQEPAGECRFLAASYEFLACLLDLGQERPPMHPRWSEFQPLLREIREHLEQSWDRATMARAAHLSPTRFHALFREVTGVAPMAWLRRERLERAKKLLMFTDDKINAIARQVGYEDPYHFSRVFHDHEHASPRDWRERARHQNHPAKPTEQAH